MPVHEPRYVESSSGLVQPWALLSSRLFLNLLSRGGREARLSIFVYHRVLPRPDALFPDEGDAEAFDRHMEQLASCFNVIPLSDAIRGLSREKLPPRAACI